MTQTITETTLEPAPQILIEFPNPRPGLTTVELQSVFADLTYLYDSVLAEQNPSAVPSFPAGSPHPRRRLRTDPENALRVVKINYGSPLQILVETAAALGPDIADVLKGVLEAAGGAYLTAVLLDRRRESKARREDKRAPRSETPELTEEETPQPPTDETPTTDASPEQWSVSPDFLPPEQEEARHWTRQDVQQGRDSVRRRWQSIFSKDAE